MTDDNDSSAILNDQYGCNFELDYVDDEYADNKLILFDDIHLGPGHMGITSGNSMQQFWDKIDNQYKLDLTSVGHWSGTGLVSFCFDQYEICM